MGIGDYGNTEIATLDTSGALLTAEPYEDLSAIGRNDLTKEMRILATQGITPLSGLAYR